MTTMQQQDIAHIDETPRTPHRCPVWMGYIIANPLRKLGENPDAILASLVTPGMTVVDVGCAMGFFSLPLARMVGGNGRVICVDIQAKMLRNLVKRARRKKLDHIIETRRSSQEDPGLGDLKGSVDLAIAVHVLHETAYPRRLLCQIHEALSPAGKFLLMEPKGHVSDQDFEQTRRLAFDVGFTEVEYRQLIRSRVLILQSPKAP